jgi:glyoxylase-like metal-dependent hydrolase (beta-lactamase superfamily II)
MIFRQFLQAQPVTAASYLLGCAGYGVAAVVDPVSPLEDYRRTAELLGVRIAFVIDMHVHADHLSTGPALTTAADATYVLHASAGRSSARPRSAPCSEAPPAPFEGKHKITTRREGRDRDQSDIASHALPVHVIPCQAFCR